MQTQLAKVISIEQPSLVRILDQLKEKGFILRQICANDRRTKRIKLAEKVGPLTAGMETAVNKTRGEILEKISVEEIDLLIKLVAKLKYNIIELQSQN